MQHMSLGLSLVIQADQAGKAANIYPFGVAGPECRKGRGGWAAWLAAGTLHFASSRSAGTANRPHRQLSKTRDRGTSIELALEAIENSTSESKAAIDHKIPSSTLYN